MYEFLDGIHAGNSSLSSEPDNVDNKYGYAIHGLCIIDNLIEIEKLDGTQLIEQYILHFHSFDHENSND